MSETSHGVCVAWLIRVMLVAVCLLVHGCTTVDGGAVELSWKLRSASGAADNFVTCDAGGKLLDSKGMQLVSGRLVDIRLHWESNDMPAYADFKCSANHGVTTFQLPAGVNFLWVSPICDNGVYTYDVEDVAPNTFSAPAPEQRSVIAGNTISLGAVELVLEVSSCGEQPCICQ
jgi:hypothetical protein